MTAVLNKLITRLRPTASMAEAVDIAHDPSQLALVLRHFPIGARLTYFPEYRRQFQFSTLILGYRINDHTLYTQDGIQLDPDGMPRAFRIDGHTQVPLARLDRLRILLPDTSAHQGKLDYVTRAELGRDGQLRKGTAITLQARGVGRGVPTLDTVVERKETLNAGPFAGHAAVVVDPDLESMNVADKRRKPRLAAAIDAELLLDDGAATSATACRLVDFSDDTLRLQAVLGTLPALKTGTAAAVQFAIGASDECYRVRGKVVRQSERHIVIQFAELYVPATDNYRRIDTIDILQIKTRLLNSGG